LITQIYEIQTPGEVDPLCAIGVDHIGSVLLAAEDWQQPLIRDTVRTVQRCGKKSSLIPLFNDPTTVFQALDYYRPDIVHFCDVLTLSAWGRDVCRRLVDLQRDVRSHFPEIAIMRSIPIGRPRDQASVLTMALAKIFCPVSDLLLTDTVLPANAGTPQQPVDGFVGITGKTCHWETARKLVRESKIPVILAGGLSPENVYDAISRVAPAGVDSCTRTNKMDRHGNAIRFSKDMDRVRRFVEEARRAASGLASAPKGQGYASQNEAGLR
jgi:phosphoribosylanthranilate isomerase